MQLKFLVVDDSRAMQAIIRRSLQNGGFGDAMIVGVGDGQSALEHVANNKPDLLITDWHMPGMSGLELLQAVRQRHGTSVKVGMITTEGSEELLRQARQSGAAFILHKPFDDADLSQHVRQVLDAPECLPQDTAERAGLGEPPPAPEVPAPEVPAPEPATAVDAAAGLTVDPASIEPAAPAASEPGQWLNEVLKRVFGQIKFRLIENEPIEVSRLSPRVLLGLLSVPGSKAAFALSLMDAPTACMIGGGSRGLLPSQVRPLMAAHAPSDEMTLVATQFAQEAAGMLVPAGSEAPKISKGNWVPREMEKLVGALSNNTRMYGYRLQVPGYGEGRMAFVVL
jgi:CheY-like chemotaxis protein